MTISHAKAVFLWGTIISGVIFLVLTYDFHNKVKVQTHEESLSPEVVSGKWVWQKYNCNDCHTILGIGGYYAPDVTKVMGYRNADWIRQFINDPGKVWPAKRRMPTLHLKEEEISDIIAFLTWVNNIDTNNWPPKPMVASATASVTAAGEGIFKTQGCSACHKIGGAGGDIGPDLSHIGSIKDKKWIKDQIINPKLHNPVSIMPSFEKLPEKDRDALANYLSGLK